MQYNNYFIKPVNFPKLTHNVEQKINYNIEEYSRSIPFVNDPNYMWTDNHNQEINEWCNDHVIRGIYYGFQISRADMRLHKDNNATVKLIYLLTTGGDNVITSFYSEDKEKKLHSVKLNLNTWYLLKTDIWHNVTGITSPRFSICATVFRKIELVKPVESF
tara:strand:- start:116 stop:598 length:483 start_codon:yes stop_codon:yes gene_type:complete